MGKQGMTGNWCL